MSSSNCSRCSMVILDGECSVCRGAVDWPAFWRSLPPREAWEAAKAMPKIAGPWQRYADGYWIREDPAYGGGGFAARQPFDGRASADAALRAAGG